MKTYGKPGQDTHDNIIQRMRIACWISRATGTHSEYVIYIAFVWQQQLRERHSMLRLYVHCLSLYIYNLVNVLKFVGHNDGVPGSNPGRNTDHPHFRVVVVLCIPAGHDVCL